VGGQHLLLYDGACGLCHGLVRVVLERDRAGVFRFASLDSRAAVEQLARFGSAPGPGETFVVIANYLGQPPLLLTKGSAAIFVMKALGWPWRAATAVGVLPTSVLDRAYDLVARHRYRVFGRRGRCVLPRPEYQDRFLDAVDQP